MTEPGGAIPIDDDVMRLDFGAGQSVFCHDHVRGTPGGTRQSPEWEWALRLLAAVDASEVFRHRFSDSGWDWLTEAAADETLRLHV